MNTIDKLKKQLLTLQSKEKETRKKLRAAIKQQLKKLTVKRKKKK